LYVVGFAQRTAIVEDRDVDDFEVDELLIVGYLLRIISDFYSYLHPLHKIIV